MCRIFSFDVSSSSTGWCLMDNTDVHKAGIIKTSSDVNIAIRLNIFRNSILDLLDSYKVDYVLVESVYLGINPKTTILLASFSGVIQEVVYEYTGLLPNMLDTKKVKQFFNVKDKESVFERIVSLYNINNAVFKKHNDITDSIAQGVYFYVNILNNNDNTGCVNYNINCKGVFDE